MKGVDIFDKILIFILVKESALYKGNSPLEAPLILRFYNLFACTECSVYLLEQRAEAVPDE